MDPWGVVRSVTSRLTHYAIALVLVLGAILVRFQLDPVVGNNFPFLVLVASVAAMVWLGGYRPALVVLILGYLVSNYLFVEPRGAFAINTTEGVVGTIAFLFTCVIVISFGETMRRARMRAAASELRVRSDDRRKDEFLALLAHELRNPLAPIRNSLSILRAGATRDDAEQAMRIMDRQLEQMVRLVDDLLDVNRMSRGTLELRRERLELAAVVRQVVAVSRPAIERAGQKLTVTLPQGPVFLDADPVRLSQIVGNVLGNASRFTPRGGEISVTAEREGGDVVVTVGDSGVGISVDKLELVFEMFSQVKSELRDAPGGLGVGLALVKHLVELHGGTILARSSGIGKGSQFVIRLSLANESGATSKPSDARRAVRRRHRILVVDDNKDSADSLALLLEMSGHETRLAYDGEDALSAAAAYQPDFILLDIGLPKLNGYEACRRIRQQDWSQRTRIIALTGWGQEEDRRKSKQAGFDDHLVKPVDQNTLMQVLEKN